MMVRSTGPPGMVSSIIVRETVPEVMAAMSSQPVVLLAPRPEPLRGKPTPVRPLLAVKTMRPLRSYQVSRSYLSGDD